MIPGIKFLFRDTSSLVAAVITEATLYVAALCHPPLPPRRRETFKFQTAVPRPSEVGFQCRLFQLFLHAIGGMANDLISFAFDGAPRL